uniref:Chromo domain-containing protein n=2 Tax=Auxenochlorella protothecoides TaxID=3075 RepID=A0A1D2AE17_AUXPR
MPALSLPHVTHAGVRTLPIHRARSTWISPTRIWRCDGTRRHPQCKSQALMGRSAHEILKVSEVKGIRLNESEEKPVVEYLVAWSDDSHDTWEPAKNLADDLLRDFEDRWWAAARQGDEETMLAMMKADGKVLARTLDEERHSALHFAAARGKPELVKALVQAGAEVNLPDRAGYTPLHMASGYLHSATIGALLTAGADPEQEDAQGRSPLGLVEGLREALPTNNPALIGRRMALEDVVKVLTDNTFEDVEPVAVLESRNEGEDREFLVKFHDSEEPEWVAARYVAEDVMQDFEAGLEYAQGLEILDMRQRGDSRAYLVRWEDGREPSWEPEEHVTPDLIELYAARDARARDVKAAADKAGKGRTPAPRQTLETAGLSM